MSTPPRVIPSPYHPLHEFRLKLNRAQTHAETLDRDIQAWRNRHPYAVVGQYEPGPPEQYVFRVRFLERPSSDWGIILGDFAHNARSALDHLVYRLACMGNNGEHVHDTKFPIVLSPFNWPKAVRDSLKCVSDRHIAIIETFQPYHRHDAYGWHSALEAIEDPLALLNRLANIDKHIVLNATPATIKSIGWDVHPIRDVAEVGDSEAWTGILVDGRELVRVNIASSGPHPELQLDRHETLEIGVQHRIYLTRDAFILTTVPLKESVDLILARLWELFQVFVHEFR